MQPNPPCSPSGTPPARFPLLRVLLTLAPLPVFGASPPAQAPAVPKPYTLFLGADLDIQQDKEVCRVQDVQGDFLIAVVKGKQQSISTTASPVNLRVQHSLKLAGTAVTIADLKGERAYSPANDPWRKWANRGTMADTGAAESQLVSAQAARDNNAASAANPNLGGFSQAAFAAQAPAREAALNSAAANFNQASAEAAGNLYNPGLVAAQTQQELAKQLFDAIEVTFDLSAPRPLTAPFVVVLAQYHDPAEPQGTAHNWIYAKALNPIKDRPEQVHILRGGFPAGFILEKFTVHLYDHGREVASNLSEKRVELTRDEAFQYTVIDYLTTHKDATLPPALAMGRRPPDLPARVQRGEFKPVCYLKVSRDGLPGNAYQDAACKQEINDPYLRAVLQDLRYTPALVKGKPIEALATVDLNDLPL